MPLWKDAGTSNVLVSLLKSGLQQGLAVSARTSQALQTLAGLCGLGNRCGAEGSRP